MSKKATIVPGVHDPIPPEGRISVELLHPDTGRVRKRVRAENALMDWFRKNAAPNGGRGEGVASSIYQFDSFNPIQETTLGTPKFPAAAVGPNSWPVYIPANNAANWLWATAQNVTPDATKHHIPTGSATGDIVSATKLDASWVPDGIQLRRGSIQLASCIRSWDRQRIVTEFGLAYGNGIYRSIGLGSIINQRISPAAMRATPSVVNNPLTNNLPDFGWNSGSSVGMLNMNLGRVGHDPDLGVFWGQTSAIYGGSNLIRWDGATEALTVSGANVPGSGGQWSVAVNGSDFWITRNKVLYRCVKPTSNVAVTVTNTYDLAATIGADTILDVAVNRATNELYLLTETRVYVVNGVTGASTSNFAHGLTFAVGDRPYACIEWSVVEQQLHISCPDAAGSPNEGWGYNAAAPANYLSPPTCLIHGFTAAGAAAKMLMVPQFNTRTSTNRAYSGTYMGLTESGFAMASRTSDPYILGPSMATHALLGSDVEKTAADALRITYDFDFV